MGAIAEHLMKLREKCCIVQRGDLKWVGDWSDRIIPPTTMRVMQSFGYIELVDRKRDDGSAYQAYVITDKGRDALEREQAKGHGKRLVSGLPDASK